jgi:hypothetical protein
MAGYARRGSDCPPQPHRERGTTQRSWSGLVAIISAGRPSRPRSSARSGPRASVPRSVLGFAAAIMLVIARPRVRGHSAGGRGPPWCSSGSRSAAMNWSLLQLAGPSADRGRGDHRVHRPPQPRGGAVAPMVGCRRGRRRSRRGRAHLRGTEHPVRRPREDRDRACAAGRCLLGGLHRARRAHRGCLPEARRVGARHGGGRPSSRPLGMVDQRSLVAGHSPQGFGIAVLSSVVPYSSSCWRCGG